MTHQWSCRLDDDISVFQGELCYFYSIRLDFSTKHKFFNSSFQRQSFQPAGHLSILTNKSSSYFDQTTSKKSFLGKSHLSNASAYKNISGIEMADILAQVVTARSSGDFSLTVPHSCIKIYLLVHFMKQWQDFMDYSDKARCTLDQISVVSLDCLQLTTDFFTSHDVFQFKQLFSDLFLK